ncbi:MAG: hypothetical protein LBQ34_04690 [Alphaproteobacteria bacterium]|nr:hypothetical protein [Alphaproteobacteria bacterium]
MKKFYLILLFLFSLQSVFAQDIAVSIPPQNDVYGNIDYWEDLQDGSPLIPHFLDSNNNNVYLNDSNLNLGGYNIYGAFGGSSDVSRNTVSITASNLTNIGYIFGGNSQANVINNTVDISENSKNTYNEIYGGSGRNIASDNKVNIKSGSFIKIYGGKSALGVADSNYIYLSNSKGDYIYGGDGKTATRNRVDVINGDLGVIIGGYSEIESSNNTVSIAAVSVVNETLGSIYGGYAYSSTGKMLVQNNVVNISGGVVLGNIYGGYAENNVAEVKDNIVNISGNPDLANASLFGGFIENGSGTISGNTLNLQTNISVKTAGGFNNYNFYTDGDITNPMLLATGKAIDMSNSVIGLYLKDNSIQLNKGDTLFLVSNMTGDKLTQASGKMRSGATIVYDWELLLKNNNLYAKIKEDISTGGGGGNGGGDGGGDGNTCGNSRCGEAGHLNPEAKSLSEGYLSSMGMLISGADLVVSTLQGDNEGMFSGINLNSIKLNSGSHVDVQSGSVILGVGSKADSLFLGAFLEAGGGNHNTYNEFNDIDSVVKGSGSNAYAGAGLFGRISSDSIYLDASIRGGYVSTDYKADYSPEAKYNVASVYYGGHAGAGLIQNMDDFSFNEYVKYLATIQQGNKVALDSSETIQFADALSSRAVVGIRSAYKSIFIGYAYEQELAGIAAATTAMGTIDSPSIKGGTNIVEAGFDKMYSRVNIGLGGKYYIGVREGYSLNAKVSYMF